MDAVRGAGALARARSRYYGTASLRVVGDRSFRSCETVGRSRRRHSRGDRFLYLLRATNAATRASQAHTAGSRRGKLSPLLATWRRVRDRAVEFSDRHSLRKGGSRSRHGKRRYYETVRAIDHLRCRAYAGVRGSRRSGGRVESFIRAWLNN